MTTNTTTKCGIALIGTGTVGTSVYELVKANTNLMAKRSGTEISIVSACANNVERAKERIENTAPVFSNWREAIEQPGVDVVVELIGGVDQALECAHASLEANKPFVTANKALLAIHGAELVAKARKCNTSIHFEAAVAGCVPAVRTVRDTLAADRINSIVGIINGTCNYITSKMAEENMPFDVALKQAMDIGYAEADPSLDIDGFDAAHKAVILSWLAFGSPLTMDNIKVKGIRSALSEDRICSSEFGYAIKLLAVIRRHAKDSIELQVTPGLVDKNHPIAKVDNNLNAVLFDSDACGELLLVGKGAGGMPTASSVVADIIEAVRGKGSIYSIPRPASNEKLDDVDSASQAYLRLRVIDSKGVLAKVSSLLSEADISIEAIHQGESLAGEQVDIAILLHENKWSKFQSVAEKFSKLEEVDEDFTLMPIVIPHTK